MQMLVSTISPDFGELLPVFSAHVQSVYQALSQPMLGKITAPGCTMLIWLPLITIIQGQEAEIYDNVPRTHDRMREELQTKDAEITRLREELSASSRGEAAKVCTINKVTR